MTGEKSLLQIPSAPQGGSILVSVGLTFVQLENVQCMIDFIHVNGLKPVSLSLTHTATHTHARACQYYLNATEQIPSSNNDAKAASAPFVRSEDTHATFSHLCILKGLIV